MKTFIALFMLVLAGVAAQANPIMIKVINEFQVAPETAERIECKWFQIPSSDTLFGPHDLYGVSVITPAGTAVIDTHLTLPGNGWAVIDTTMLTGPFDLPNSAGYIKMTQGWRDTVVYPLEVETPGPGASAALFYVYYYSAMDGFSMHGDWYVDPTPTFGSANDDYPGCVISGRVFDPQSQPVIGARVVANASSYALERPPFYKACTTYTATDGSYIMDSLLPFCYWVKVTDNYYYPDSYYTQYLKSRTPTTVNFYLTGAAETVPTGAVAALTVAPNPFRRAVQISAGIRIRGLRLNIYDISSRLIKTMAFSSSSNSQVQILTWDGTDQNGYAVPPGVYFAALVRAQGLQAIKIIKTK